MMRGKQICLLAALAAFFAACGDDEDAGKDAPEGKSCSTVADCGSTSPTAACNAGVCEDPAWDCIGDPDERPAMMSGTATLRVGLVTTSGDPIATEVNVRACPLPTSAEDMCATPLAGTTATYVPGPGGGITVTGLPQGQPFRLFVEPKTAGEFVPIDFYSERPVRDTTVQVAPLYTFAEALLPFLSASFTPPIPYDANAGILVGIHHDCQGRLASGVVTAVRTGEAPAARVLYFSSENLPDPSLTMTTSSGVSGAINLPTDKVFTMTSKAYEKSLPDYGVRALPRRVTVVHSYPRDYTP